MAGLYIHIPFCVSKCSYCDFYSCTATASIDSYVGALCREMRSRKDYLGGRPIKTIYFGGGTPSLMSAWQIRAVTEDIYKLFDPDPEEITLEANPDDLTPKYLAEIAATTPVNRLSIGIQSFDEAGLRLMNRRHTAEQAARAVKEAQRAGFGNISADLIFGIPGMDDRTWELNIDRLISLGVQHISAYHLTIEEGTEFSKMAARGEIAPVGEDTSERQYDTLCGKLSDAGFCHYEISNFALPGKESRHNSSYWKDEPYLGLGPSAHSYDGTQRCVCTADAGTYIRESPDPAMFETEKLTPQERHNEHIMVRLRCSEGIDIEVFRNKFGAEKTENLLSRSENLIRNGLLYNKNGHLAVPCERFLVSDRIISELFDI